MPKEIVSEEEITLPQVKKILSTRGKESDLSFQQTITLEHASAFSRMAPAVAAKLVERLKKNFDISQYQAVQIINIAPTTIEELKTTVDLRSIDLTDEQLEEIVEIITKSRTK
ncbi:MAG: RNA polymerase Rpb4 family protein [Candidatus Thorarchaeota archaeon]